MFRASDRYGVLNSYDVLKLIALLAMIIDHLGYYLFPQVLELRDIGRIAFPIFLYLVGYSASFRLRHDLILWGAFVTAGEAFTHHPILPFNILITIAVVRWLLPPLLKRSSLTPLGLAILFIIFVVWYPLFFWCDYSSVAFMFALSGYLQRQTPGSLRARVFLCASMLFHFLLEMAVFGPSHLPGMALTLSLTLYILWGFGLRPVSLRILPLPDQRILQFLSRNTLPIYGIHLVLFMALEWIYFPARVHGFRWF